MYTRSIQEIPPTSQENVKRSKNSNRLENVKQELATIQSYKAFSIEVLSPNNISNKAIMTINFQHF